MKQKSHVLKVLALGILAVSLGSCNSIEGTEEVPTQTPIVVVVVEAVKPVVQPTATLSPSQTPVPKTATPTATKRVPTRTSTPPSPTATATQSTTLGRGPETAVVPVAKTQYRVPAGASMWFDLGTVGNKMKIQITSFSGGAPEKVMLRIWSDQQIQELTSKLKEGAPLPPPKGVITYKDSGKFSIYEGGNGSSKTSWKGEIRNENSTEFSLTISVEDKPAFCADKPSGTYFEGFWWTTCDPNWLSAFH